MKTLLFILVLNVFVGLQSATLWAQIERAPSVVACSGMSGKNENFSISWTLGELAINTLQGENTILTQGFQQASITELGIKKDISYWDISVFPNPFQSELNILFKLRESKKILLEIQDPTGRILLQQQHENIYPGDLIIINTSDLINGFYFMRIFSADLQLVDVKGIMKL